VSNCWWSNGSPSLLAALSNARDHDGTGLIRWQPLYALIEAESKPEPASGNQGRLQSPLVAEC